MEKSGSLDVSLDSLVLHELSVREASGTKKFTHSMDDMAGSNDDTSLSTTIVLSPTILMDV